MISSLSFKKDNLEDAFDVELKKFLEDFTGSNLFSAEIYFLSKLPSKIIISEVVFVILIAFILSLSATIYPAWRASKIDPIKVLRHA